MSQKKRIKEGKERVICSDLHLKLSSHKQPGMTLFYVVFIVFQEPIHLRNRELLVLRTQLQQKVEELQKELEIKNSRGILGSSPPRMSSPVNV